MTIKILQMNEYQPLGPAIKKPIAEKPFTPEQVRPGVFKGADGKLYTDFKANEPPAVFHPPKQQVPSALATVNDWFEHNGSKECPIPNALGGEWEYMTRDGERHDSSMNASNDVWDHFGKDWDIVAYRLIQKAEV